MKPVSKWVPKRGTMLLKNMETGKGNSSNQQGAYAMSTVEMILFGGAAEMETSGRSLVGLQVQVHEGGPNSLKVKRLLDALKLKCKGAYSQQFAPIGGSEHKWYSCATRKVNWESTRTVEESHTYGFMWNSHATAHSCVSPRPPMERNQREVIEPHPPTCTRCGKSPRNMK